MNTGTFFGVMFALAFTIGLFVLIGFFLYWIAKILIILPMCLLRVTAAIEKIANAQQKKEEA